MPDNSKALSKLIIHSFDKNDFKVEDKSKLFTTPINPESFTKNYKVELDTAKGMASQQPTRNTNLQRRRN